MAEENDREVKKSKSANRGENLATLLFGIVIGYLLLTLLKISLQGPYH